MLLEPGARQLRDSIQRARLLEQVGCAGDDFETPFGSARELCHGFAIESLNHGIVAPDDEQTGRKHTGQRRSRKIRPASPRHDCLHYVRATGRRSERGCRAGAGSEVTKPEVAQILLPADPARNRRQPPDQ
jgi:hypothetical protein